MYLNLPWNLMTHFPEGRPLATASPNHGDLHFIPLTCTGPVPLWIAIHVQISQDGMQARTFRHKACIRPEQSSLTIARLSCQRCCIIQ